MARAALPNKTRELLERVEAGDREACLDLAQLYKPENITELVLFVRPDGGIPTDLFDRLADSFSIL